MNKLEQDRADLDAALVLVRKLCPGAVAVNLETSDQNRYGFVLTSVEYESGETIPREVESGLSEGIDIEVSDLLSDLDWNGVVGESPQGYARVSLLRAKESCR